MKERNAKGTGYGVWHGKNWIFIILLYSRSADETGDAAELAKKAKSEEGIGSGGLDCMVYAVGLPYTVTEEEVKEFFSECGKSAVF